MILKVDVPYLESSVKGGVITEWHKAEGERVAFGEPLCTIAVDEWLGLRRDKRANVIAGIDDSDDRQIKGMNRYELRKRRGVMFLDIVASEPAILRRMVAQEGDRVELGQTLALVSSGDDGTDDLDVDPDRISTLRTVARATEMSEDGAR